MRTNAVVGGLLAVLGTLIDAPVLAEESGGTTKSRDAAQSAERGNEQPDVAQSLKSKDRQRVRYTYPPTKR